MKRCYYAISSIVVLPLSLALTTLQSPTFRRYLNANSESPSSVDTKPFALLPNSLDVVLAAFSPQEFSHNVTSKSYVLQLHGSATLLGE